MKSLKQESKKFYASKELSMSQLESLQGLTLQKKKNPFIWLLTGLAVLTISFFVFRPSLPLENTIIQEVVKNHLKNMPVEIKSENLNLVRLKLNKLDFALISSNYTKNLSLVGARYCSIQSILAAQLQYQESNGKIHTVYEVSLPKKFESHSGHIATNTVKGVKVSLYAEKGLLIVDASSQD